MPPKKVRQKTKVLKQVSKEIKTAIFNDVEKYGSPTSLKATILPTLGRSTPEGKTQSFIIVDPTQCLPYFVCKTCAVPMGPITCHRKCFLNKCQKEDDQKIKKRYTRAVQRLSKIEKKKDTEGKPHGKDEVELSKGMRVTVQYDTGWFEGEIKMVNKLSFRVKFDDGNKAKIMKHPKQGEGWKIIQDKN